MLQIQPYDLEFSYRPGTEIAVVDTISRLHLPDIDKKLHREIEVCVHQIAHALPVSNARLEEIRLHTKEDEHLIYLREAIQGSWPNARKQCAMDLLAYWNLQHELSYMNGIIFKGERIVIPRKMRPQILQQLHVSHLGMEKTKQCARMLVYWPKMNGDIKRQITNCPTCQKHSCNNQKEPLMNSQIQLVPWQQVASDIFDWNEAKYLITVDYHSHFFEVNLLKNLTSKEVISKLKSHFAQHRIPHTIISDNRTQYSST
ncbi:hypothetical protein QYM36_015852 [Artemia franciscana]|uniref:RNA-directed DNA polymerase n=1 Tax=Artemia franciscana TaxID=6661 RepID=A0AA88KXA7_ARTSF|nr:hypothetical protein QYM36_015852 [Artemia franciscana]